MTKQQGGMFKLLRLFLIISAISIVVTTALVTVLYRQMTVRATDNLAQASSLALAQMAMISVRQELDDYLDTAADGVHQEIAAQRLAARLTEAVEELAHDSPGRVVRVILFNRRGVVIFSTDRDQVGQSQVDNDGFMSAINGRVASNLVYRDVFNRFGGGPEAVRRGLSIPTMLPT
jgi:sensor histidine kinase regulating citrate/malate metabolism